MKILDLDLDLTFESTRDLGSTISTTVRHLTHHESYRVFHVNIYAHLLWGR